MNAEVPHYAPIPKWCELSGLSRTVTYLELAHGNLRAVKIGSKTLIDVRAGLAWLATLPAAQVKVPSLVKKAARAAQHPAA